MPWGQGLGSGAGKVWRWGFSGRELSTSWLDGIWDDFHKMNGRMEISKKYEGWQLQNSNFNIEMRDIYED